MKSPGFPPVRTAMMLVLFVWIAGWHSGLASEPFADAPREVRTGAGAVLTLGGAGDYLSNVSNFIAAEGSRITLSGKRGATFVVHVSGDFEISGATLLLAGGLLPSDVMFHLNSPAPAVRRRIAGHSEFFGCVVANGTPVTISNSTVNGRKISGPIERAVIFPLKPPPRPRGPVGP